jgi:hypothetical protein
MIHMCLHGKYMQDIKKIQMMLNHMNFDRYLEVNIKGSMIYVHNFHWKCYLLMYGSIFNTLPHIQL